MSTRPPHRPPATHQSTNAGYLANQPRPSGRGYRASKENEQMQLYSTIQGSIFLLDIESALESNQRKNQLSAARRQETIRKKQDSGRAAAASSLQGSHQPSMGLLQDLRDGDLGSPLSQAFINSNQTLPNMSQSAFQKQQTPRYHAHAADSEHQQLPLSTDSFNANNLNTPYSGGLLPQNASPSPLMQVLPAATEPTSTEPTSNYGSGMAPQQPRFPITQTTNASFGQTRTSTPQGIQGTLPLAAFDRRMDVTQTDASSFGQIHTSTPQGVQGTPPLMSFDQQMDSEVPYQEDPWGSRLDGHSDEEQEASDDNDTGSLASQNPRHSVLQITARKVHLSKSSKKKRKRKQQTQSDDTADSDDGSDSPQNKRFRNIKTLSRSSKRVIEKAFEIFKAKLTSNPWPEDDEEGNGEDEESEVLDEASMMAIDSWMEACEKLDIEAEITEEITKRIRERMAQFRGQLRDCVRKEMESSFGFIDVKRLADPLASPERIAAVLKANADIVAAIQNSFWYTNPHDKSVPNSMYYNPIIQKVFNLNWFGDGTFRRASYFKGATEVQPQTVALILCAVFCAIEEWSTGRRTTRPFSRKAYYKRYKEYLDYLIGWQEFTANEEQDLAKIFLQGLLRNARAASGEVPEEHIEIAQTNAKAAALEAYRANQG